MYYLEYLLSKLYCMYICIHVCVNTVFICEISLLYVHGSKVVECTDTNSGVLKLIVECCLLFIHSSCVHFVSYLG